MSSPRKFEFRSADGRVCCSTDDPRYLCAKCKTKLAAGGAPRAMELRTAVRPVVKRAVDPGDPYAALTYPVKVEPCPYDDPHYDPKGEPPDGHQIALNNLPKKVKR